MTLQRIMLSVGLLTLIGIGFFSPSVTLAQTTRTPKSKTPAQRKLSARQIAQRTAPSVVLLVTADEGGNPIALGSGFFVQSNVIATAYHVIKDASQCYGEIAGRRARHKISFIGSSDEKADLALLRIDDVKGQPLKLGNLSRLRVGDEIYVMGNPEGLEGTFSRGNISAIRNTEGLIQITAPISHGSSGGPVLDERGEVIGVATGIFTEGQNLNFAVPVSKLAALLKENSNPYLIRNSAPVPDEPTLEWQLVNSGGGIEYYISRRITLTAEHTFLVWIKRVPNDSPEGRADRKQSVDLLNDLLNGENVNRSYAFSYTMEHMEFDCGHQKERRLKSAFYDREGELLYEHDFSTEREEIRIELTRWYTVLPDSVGEGQLNFVCKGRQ